MIDVEQFVQQKPLEITMFSTIVPCTHKLTNFSYIFKVYNLEVLKAKKKFDFQ